MAVGTKAARQFQALFDTIPFKATVDFGSAADAGFVAADITVTGAVLGSPVIVAIGVDVVDVGVSAQVTAADTVTVVLDNNTGGAVDLASTTVTGMVFVPKGVYNSL
jgi:hypothetical protein